MPSSDPCDSHLNASELPWIRIGQRAITVVNNTAFYKSTGNNSNCPGVWLPIIGLYDGEAESYIGDTIMTDQVLGYSDCYHIDLQAFNGALDAIYDIHIEKGYLLKYDISVLKNDYALSLSHVDNRDYDGNRVFCTTDLKLRMPLDEHLHISARLNPPALITLLANYRERFSYLQNINDEQLTYRRFKKSLTSSDALIADSKNYGYDQAHKREQYELACQINRLQTVLNQELTCFKFKSQPDQVFYNFHEPQSHECVEAARYANKWLAYQGAAFLKGWLFTKQNDLAHYVSFEEQISSVKQALIQYNQQGLGWSSFLFNNSACRAIVAAGKLQQICRLISDDHDILPEPIVFSDDDIQAFETNLASLVKQFRQALTGVWSDELQERLLTIVAHDSIDTLEELVGADIDRDLQIYKSYII